MLLYCSVFLFCFFKQKTAYEMRISDWSSDVCSSDLPGYYRLSDRDPVETGVTIQACSGDPTSGDAFSYEVLALDRGQEQGRLRPCLTSIITRCEAEKIHRFPARHCLRSEEHTSELQSLVRISYAVFCLKKKKQIKTYMHTSYKV